MKVTEEYVEWRLPNGQITRVYKKDDPALYFTMGSNTEDTGGFGRPNKPQEDYNVTESYGIDW